MLFLKINNILRKPLVDNDRIAQFLGTIAEFLEP